MLIQFNFGNFRSFKGETCLDMTAGAVREYPWHVISAGSEKLLPVCGIWGANASGKSNILKALRFMALYVLRSFGFGGDLQNHQVHMMSTPFLFDKVSSEEPGMFEAVFIPDHEKGWAFQYGFTLGPHGVEEEWLNYRTKTAKAYKRIFTRHGMDVQVEKRTISQADLKRLIPSLYPEVLLVSLGAKLKIELLREVYDWFSRISVTNFGNPGEDEFLSHVAPDRFLTREVQERVLHFLSGFDSSIIDFKVQKLPDESNDGALHFHIGTIHGTKNGDEVEIPMREESDGTQKMFALYQHMLNALSSGGLLVVDELDSKLHPLLQRVIVQEFIKERLNPNHGQIIFTVHDPWILSSKLLRRDEVWFTEKGKEGESSLFSLADFREEKGEYQNFELNYLLGRYGAIPDIRTFNLLEDQKYYDKKQR